MKLTKLKALQICRELWVWMRDTKATRSYQKEPWQGWETYGKMDSDCPCCEYKRRHRLVCADCLLLSLWGESDAWNCFPCMSKSSPYSSFHRGCGTPADAQRIIDACAAEIKKLKKARKEEAK